MQYHGKTGASLRGLFRLARKEGFVMNRSELNENIREEWRELGFYYDFSKEKNQWIFVSSKAGLLKFCELLDKYILNPNNWNISAHDHYGPYMYLKVLTWNEAIISEHAIVGTIDDLGRLSNLLKDKLMSVKTFDSFYIDKEYSLRNEAILCFDIKEDEFDPSSLDEFV